jgi:hypothetical protein
MYKTCGSVPFAQAPWQAATEPQWQMPVRCAQRQLELQVEPAATLSIGIRDSDARAVALTGVAAAASVSEEPSLAGWVA